MLVAVIHSPTPFLNSPSGAYPSPITGWDLIWIYYGFTMKLLGRLPVVAFYHCPLLTYTQKSKKNKGKCQLFFIFLKYATKLAFFIHHPSILYPFPSIFGLPVCTPYIPKISIISIISIKKMHADLTPSRKHAYYNNIYIYI